MFFLLLTTVLAASDPQIHLDTVSAGLTNESRILSIGQDKLFVRSGYDRPDSLGISRELEKEIHQVVSHAGLAPKIYFVNPETGTLVSEFIEGHHLTPEEYRYPDEIKRLAKVLHSLHQLNRTQVPDSRRVWKNFISSVPFFHNSEEEKEVWVLIEEYLSENLGLCHNDLVPENIIKKKSDERLYLIDWEYSSVGNCFYDLASFSIEHGFSTEEESYLMKEYCSGYDESDWECFNRMKTLYCIRNIIWAWKKTQDSGSSPLFEEVYRLAYNKLPLKFQGFLPDELPL